MERYNDYWIAEQIRKEGTAWVMKQRFWLFGTATYTHGADVTFEDATRHGRRFFNALDRAVLPRKQLREGQRLRRLAFIERGRLRANTHIHFFIKGFEWPQYHSICNSSKQLWNTLIDGAADIRLQDNVTANTDRAGYCWKEVRGDLADVLLTDCCHLD